VRRNKDVVGNDHHLARQETRLSRRTASIAAPRLHEGKQPLPSETPRSGARKRAAAAAVFPKPSAALLNAVETSLSNAKAEEVVSLDLDGKSTIADQMVIASGRSSRHVAAIAEQLLEKLRGEGQRDLKVEGLAHCDWVLIDAGDVVVHIFRPEVRSFYNLEKLWSPAAPGERMAI